MRRGQRRTHPATEILEIEIGYGLIPIVDAEQSGELLEKIRAIRKQMAVELGVVVPPMKLRDNLQLKAGEYLILLKGIEMGRGELMTGYVLTMGPEDKQKTIDGIPTREPVFNLDAYWVREKDRDQYVAAGLTVVDSDNHCNTSYRNRQKPTLMNL